MKKYKNILLSALLAILPLSGVFVQKVSADTTIAGETFGGISTPANQWLHGGSGTGACLTAASTNAANSIPACSGGPFDSAGSGALRLTNDTNNQSGFAIYNTPVSTSGGLDIQFDMYQYHGSGADGIVFFLIDGSKSPTQAGALGGSLGYSSADGGLSPGIVGGYVGVGFDRYGNFSNPAFGSDGPGREQNSVTLRGSEATDYKFIATHPANGELGVEAATTRPAAKRHVHITISTGNVMNVAVNYEDGDGEQTELSNINLNTVNGSGSLPATFKFGFSAGTGGSNNIHEVGGFTTTPLHPNVSAHTGTVGDIRQGEAGTLKLYGTNDTGAESTTGTITMTDTFPSTLHVLSAEGDGWTCTVTGQHVSCARPGDGVHALAPGASTPTILVHVQVADDVDTASTQDHTAVLSTTGNMHGDSSALGSVLVLDPSDIDGVKDSIEQAAPNAGDANDDGVQDSQQMNVTSFPNQLTGQYSVLESSGDCANNEDVSILREQQNTIADAHYSYPSGLMNFTLTCNTPGGSATVTQYYFGTFDLSKYVLRKYNSTTNTYQTIDSAVLSTVTIGGKPALKAVYQVTDGGALDEDGVADGHIVDPAGPALLDPTTGTLTDTGISVLLFSAASGCIVTSALAVSVQRRKQDSLLP